MPQKRSSYRRQTNLPGITRAPRSAMNDWTLKSPKGWQFPQKLVDQLHGRIPPIPSPHGPMQMPLAGLGQAPDIALPNQGRTDWRIPPKQGELGVRPDRGLQRFQSGPLTSQRPPEPTSMIKRPPTGMGPVMPRSSVIDGEILGAGKSAASGGWKGALRSGFSKLGLGLGRLSGALTLGPVAGRIDKEFYTPYDTGEQLYDMFFGSDNNNLSAQAQELPPLDVDHNREDIHLPWENKAEGPPRPVKKPTIRPKQKKPLSIAKPPSLGLEELESLPGEEIPIPNAFGQFGPMHKVEPLPELKSENLPNQVSLGAQNKNTTLSNDSLYPDTQDSGRQSAMQRYMETVNNMPGKDGYEPSIWRKILGGIAGASEGWRGGAGAGLATSTAFVNEPRDRALAEWQTQLNELEPLMEAESKENINRERIAEQARKTDLINQTKTVENEIRLLATQGKITNDADRNKVMMGIAEIKQDIANGQMEIAKGKLEQLKNYQASLIGIQQQSANTRSAVGASLINKNNAAADRLRAEPTNQQKPPANPTSVVDRATFLAGTQAALKMGINPEEFMGMLYAPDDPDDPEGNEQKSLIRAEYNKQLETLIRAAGIPDPTPYLVRR